MEATGSASVGGSVPDGSRAALLREPLFWGAVAAFSGAILGLFGTVRQAALGDSFYVDPAAQLLAQIPGFVGEALVMSSSLGAVYLVWNVLRGTGRRVALSGTALLALLLMAEAVGVAASIYWSTGERWQGYAVFPFPALEAASYYATVFLPPVVLLPFTALALAAREKRIGVLLSILFLLSLPFGALRFWLFPPEPSAMIEPTTELVASLLGSVVDDLVSEDFRDLKRSSRGKLAMERVFSALRKSYPDLVVSIEAQEAEDDLVRTRLELSGTDRGGVLWYPPTGRYATFTAEFVDRFSGGKLVEHSGQADTEDLLRQLGLPATHAPSDIQS